MSNNINIQQACALLTEVTRLLSTSNGVPADNSSNSVSSEIPSVLMSPNGQRRPLPQMPGSGHPSSRHNLTHQSSLSDSNAFGDHQGGTFVIGNSPQSNGSSMEIAEMRRLFSPYSRTGGRAPAPTVGRPTFRRSVVPVREWRHRFYCLAGPNQMSTPTTAMKVCLQEVGLGQMFITTVANASPSELKCLLQEIFPKLLNTDFELLRSCGGGVGKPLIRIDDRAGIPAVSVLITSRVGLIYIRTLSEIWEFEIEVEDENSHVLCNDVRSEISESTRGLETLENAGIPAATWDHRVDEIPVVLNDESVEDGLGRTNTSLTSINLLSTCEDLGNIEDFRAETYRENEGVQNIFVQRDDFLHQIVGLYLKPDRLNIKKLPEVIFAGESGRDTGGLTKEFFQLALTSIVSEKYQSRFSIFEGEYDHLVPSQDGILLMSGVFKAVGRLMSHSFIHTGVAAFGISPSVAEYLCIKEVDYDTPVNIEFEDIASLETRAVVEILDRWNNGYQIAEDDMKKIVDEAALCGFNDNINYGNKTFLREILIRNNVIGCRRSQLEDIKTAFRDFGIGEFLQDRPHLWNTVFPKEAENTYTGAFILGKIVFKGENQTQIKEWFAEYLQKMEAEDGGLRNLLIGWTAWPYVTSERLVVETGEFEFCVHTCFNKIEVPVGMSKDELFAYLKMATQGGFGGV